MFDKKLSDVTVGELVQLLGIDVLEHRRRLALQTEAAEVAATILEDVLKVASSRPVEFVTLRSAREIMEWAVEQRRVIEECGSRELTVVYRRS